MKKETMSTHSWKQQAANTNRRLRSSNAQRLNNRTSLPAEIYKKSILEKGGAWSRMVRLYNLYVADKSEETSKNLDGHIIWHQNDIWYEMPENYDFHQQPIEFWLKFRDAADWEIVEDILNALPADYVHEYLIAQQKENSYSYGDDLEIIRKRKDCKESDRNWIMTRYSLHTRTITPEQAAFGLDELSKFMGDGMNNRHERSLIIDEFFSSCVWDGTLPDNVTHDKYSDTVWLFLLDEANASTVKDLLKILPEKVIRAYFNTSSGHSELRTACDLSFVCERESNKGLPQEWVEALYLSETTSSTTSHH